MIQDAASVQPGARLRYDVAIVGAGAAGITAGRLLKSRGARVVVLEAGDRMPVEVVDEDYSGTIEQPSFHRLAPMTQSRLRYFGGSTNHWAGWSRPFLPEVFTHRDWVAGDAWPFSANEMQRHYSVASEILELGGGEAGFDSRAVARRLNLPLHFESDSSLDTPLWRFSPPTRFAEAYGQDFAGTGLDLLLRSPVIQVDVRDGRVKSLTAARDSSPGPGPTDSHFQVEADTYVFAMGGIESVRQLLILDRRNPELGLNRSGWLGRGWMEHPHALVGFVQGMPSSLDFELFIERPDDGFSRVKAGLGLRSEVRREHKLAALSFTLERHQSSTQSGIGPAISRFAAVLGRGDEAFSLYARTEQRPHFGNRISLSSDSDRFGLPQPVLSWRLLPSDIRDLRVGLELVAARLAAYGLGFVFDYEAPSGAARVVGGNHHMGGAKMHESPDRGVVDAIGRVHALKNLVIASSAIFPTSCFSNPTMTIVALASRFSEGIS